MYYTHVLCDTFEDDICMRQWLKSVNSPTLQNHLILQPRSPLTVIHAAHLVDVLAFLMLLRRYVA